jgi:uncharacterized protein (DUF1330 family)
MNSRIGCPGREIWRTLGRRDGGIDGDRTTYRGVRVGGRTHHRQRLRVSGLGPTSEQFAALLARSSDEPVVMVNLLTFRKDGGVESYLRYAEGVMPHLEKAGATVRYSGGSPTTVIGDGERPVWDAIVVVEYPSPQAFVDMVTDPDYLKVHEHRAAGLDRGDLIATSTWTVAE